MVKKPPTPQESEEEEPVRVGSSYDEESDLDPKDIIEKKMKGKVSYQAKPKKVEVKAMIQQQNAQVVQQKKEKKESSDDEDDEQTVEKGKRLQKVLGKKKTVCDHKGDEWEVVDKRDTYFVKKNINSSDSGSELSFDWRIII